MDFDSPDAGNRGVLVAVCEVAGGITALAWKLIRLPVYLVLVIGEPVVRIGMTTIALLGIFTSIVLAFSGAAPRFPLWGALLFFVGCGALPSLYRTAVRLFAP